MSCNTYYDIIKSYWSLVPIFSSISRFKVFSCAGHLYTCCSTFRGVDQISALYRMGKKGSFNYYFFYWNWVCLQLIDIIIFYLGYLGDEKAVSFVFLQRTNRRFGLNGIRVISIEGTDALPHRGGWDAVGRWVGMEKGQKMSNKASEKSLCKLVSPCSIQFNLDSVVK